MKYIHQNKGTCSRSTEVVLAEDHTIEDIIIVGGCNGNLKGIRSLLLGQKAEEVIARLKGTECGNKGTSCPDQIALTLEEALSKM